LHYRILLATLGLSALLVLSACNTVGGRVSDALEDEVKSNLVGEVKLVVAHRQPPQPLEVGVVLFDPGIPRDVSKHQELGVYPQIRTAEARYIPYLLRKALVDSNQWGPVRVVPQADSSLALLVQGTIVRADGLQLALDITVRDSSGRVWLDRIYRDEAVERDYLSSQNSGADPFGDIYRKIANDMALAMGRLSKTQLRRVTQIAELMYARQLSPQSFAHYLSESPEGDVELVRLPAVGDPMLARIGKLRDKQHLFTDTVDQHYMSLYEEMSNAYLLWRQYGREIALYKDERERRLQDRQRSGRRGSFTAMQEAYAAYRWSKVQQEDMDELAQGFNNEVAPTVVELDGRVFHLTGSLQKQYQKWQGILEELFALESGL